MRFQAGRSVLLVERVLHAANGILNLAFDLIALAFGFETGIADQLAGGFLDLATSGFHGAFNAIMVHDVILPARIGRLLNDLAAPRLQAYAMNCIQRVLFGP
jgi:hypothetical protein